MRIALIGYGKMGKLIEQLALENGHEVVLRLNSENRSELTPEALSAADVAIEFTTPHTAYENVSACLRAGTPVVCGSTGWNHQMPAIRAYCREVNGCFLYASNFSIGVNLFFEVNKQLARLMRRQTAYEASITEVHHRQKKDQPSGTAVTLAEQVLEEITRKRKWVNEEPASPDDLYIRSERIDPAPGTHHVKYTSAIDDIEIIHTAHNRNGFALGALAAAEFVCGRQGIYSMSDVLSL
ncbi:MAG: 4-hydroxy-tetrahydrodipicolinate reductase [Chitinophagaceae bacterium]